MRLDISQPLCRGRKVGLGDQDYWVSFKYEWLPNFCYWCGLLTHDEKECEIWLRFKCSFSTTDQQYRTWLRGEQDHVFRKPHSFSEKNRQDHRSRLSKKGSGETGSAPVTKPGVPKHVEKESIKPLMVIPKISPLPNQRKSTFEEQL